MSPVLKSATSNYQKFTKQLTDLNKKSQAAVDSMQNTVSGLFKSFADLPKQAVKSYEKTSKELQKRIKPLTQKVNVVFTPKSERTFSAAISKAISKSLSKVTVRLSASKPLSRTVGYDTSKSLQAAYREMVQPPDMRGGFQGIPKFAEGGEVTDGKGKGIDDVLALLSKGEIVLPSDIAEKLKIMASAAFDSGGAMASSEAMENLTGLVSDLTRELGKLKNQRISEEFDAATKSMDKTENQMEDLTDTVEEADTAFGRLMQKTLGPATFLALSRSLENLKGSFGNLKGQAEGTFDVVGGGTGPISGFFENMNAANLVLGESREELAQTKTELIDLSKQFDNVGVDQFGQAFRSMVEQGTGKEFAQQNAGLVAQMTQLGTSAEDAAARVYELRNSYGLATEQVIALEENNRRFADGGAITYDELSKSQEENLKTLGSFIAMNKLNAIETENLLTGLNQTTVALTTNWGAAGGEMSKMMSEAIADPSSDAAKSLLAMGVNLDEMRMSAMKGDVSGALTQIIDRVSALGASSPFVEKLHEQLKFPGTATEMVKVATEGGKMLKTQEELIATTLKGADAVDAHNKRLAGSESAFGSFTKDMGKWVAGVIPESVIEFFDSFSLQAIISTALLAKVGAGFLKAGTSMFKFGKGGKMAVDSLSKAGKATETLGKVSKGSGAISKGGGFLGGIARGLGMFANPKVIIGIAVITGTVYAASLIVVDFIENLAGAASKNKAGFDILFSYLERFTGQVIDGFVTFIDALKGLKTGQILAVAGGLLAIGPALSMMGTGLAALGAGALLSIPGLLALGKVLPMLGGGSGEAGSIADTITALMEAFQLDTTLAKKAVISIGAAALFMGGLAAVTVQFGVMKAAALIDKANPMEGIAQVFGQGSLSKMLEKQASNIVKTVDALAETFGNINKTTVKKMQASAPILSGMASFLADYALIAASMAGIKLAAGADKLMGDTMQLVFGQGSLSMLKDQKGQIIATVKALSDFGSSFTKSELDSMEAAAPVFESVAKFLKDYASVQEIIEGLEPSALDALSDWYVEAIGGDSPMASLQKKIPEIRDVILGIATEFTLLNKTLTDEMVASTNAGIMKSIDLIKAFAPVVEQTDELQELTEGLESGFFGKISDWIGLTDSPLDQLKKTMMGDGDKDGIIGVLSSISTFISSKAKTWTGLLNIKSTAKVMSSVGSMMTDMLGATKAFEEAGDIATSAGVSGIVKARENIINMFSGIVGTIEQLTGLEMEAKLAVPVTTKAEIESAVRVDNGDNTDRPLLSAAQESNMLLGQILKAVQSQTSGTVTASTPTASVRPVNARTRNLAHGGD